MTEADNPSPAPDNREETERFTAMLSLAQFHKALEIAAKRTAKTGHETGFDVEILDDASFWIEEVREGGTLGMEYAVSLAEIDGIRDYNLPVKPYFHFHFHPDEEGMIAPSPSDFHAFQDIDIQPEYIGIGQVDKQQEIKILVIGKPRYRLTESDIAYYEEELDRIKSSDEVRRVLEALELRSFILTV